MGALAANKDRDRKNAGGLQQFPVSDGEHVYEGAACCLDVDGYLVPASNVADRVFMGVAYEEGNNISTILGHADGFIKTRLYRKGVFKFASAALAQTDLGIKVYLTDDNTVDVSSTSDKVLAGVLVELISATEGWVEIDSGVAVGALST